MSDGDDPDEPEFKSSSYSGTGNCVEVQQQPSRGAVALRHSRHRDRAPLVFTPEEWAAFVLGVKDGEFDPV